MRERLLLACAVTRRRFPNGGKAPPGNRCGLRWEPRASRCFASCHAAAESLSWMPAVEPPDVKPVLDWIRQANPALDEIDRRLDATIMKPGPHIFTQGFSKPIRANPDPTPADPGGAEASPSQTKE